MTGDRHVCCGCGGLCDSGVPCPMAYNCRCRAGQRVILGEAVTVRRLAGSCSNGFERDGGTLWHAVAKDRALCGAEPGRRSAGWSDPRQGDPTCERCRRRLERGAP